MAAAVVPSDILQENLGNVVKIERTHTKIPSDVQSYQGNGARAIFTIPSAYLCDLRRAYFSMRTQLTNGAGSTYSGLPQPIQSLFSRCQVFVGSTSILDVQSSGQLQGLFKVCSQYNSVINKSEDLIYDQAQNRAASVIPRQWLFRFNYETLQRIYPLESIGSGGMRIELTFDQLSNSCTYDAAAPTGVFDRLEFNYHTIRPTQEVRSLVDGLIASGSYEIKTWNWESQRLSVLGGTSSSLNLSFKHKACRGVITAMQLATTESSGTFERKFLLGYPENDISSAQLRIGSESFPQNPYDMSVAAAGRGFNAPLLIRRSFFEWMFGSHARQGDDFGSMDSTAVPNLANSLILCYDLRRDDSGTHWGDGFDTNTTSASFIEYLQWASASANLTAFNYVCYEGCVTVRQGGGGIIFEQ